MPAPPAPGADCACGCGCRHRLRNGRARMRNERRTAGADAWRPINRRTSIAAFGRMACLKSDEPEPSQPPHRAPLALRNAPLRRVERPLVPSCSLPTRRERKLPPAQFPVGGCAVQSPPFPSGTSQSSLSPNPGLRRCRKGSFFPMTYMGRPHVQGTAVVAVGLTRQGMKQAPFLQDRGRIGSARRPHRSRIRAGGHVIWM